MKITSLFATTTVLVLLSAPAMAQQTGQVAISGSAPAVCSASGTFINITLGNLIDTANGGLKASQVNGKTAKNSSGLFCNGVNSTLSLTASSLTAGASLPTGAASAGFANQVTFRATASLVTGGYSSDAVTATDLSDTTSSAGTPDLIGLLAAPVNTLEITLTEAALPGSATFLMADGAYSGSVTLTIAAQL
jgi:hypothetical protein